MFKIKIRTFGAFRKYFEDHTVEVSLNGQVNVNDFKSILQDYFKKTNKNFNEEKLVFESAIACDDEILDDSFIINKSMNLAILPPVCGG